MKLHTDFSTLQKQSNEYCQTKTFSCFEYIKIKMQKKEMEKQPGLNSQHEIGSQLSWEFDLNNV